VSSRRPAGLHPDLSDRRVEALRRLIEHAAVTAEILPAGSSGVWLATATADGAIVDVAAGLSPLTAATRLAEQLHDAHPCQLCGRPRVVDPHPDDAQPEWCALTYDPDSDEYHPACAR
jgi:hypothetical protein